MIAQKRSECLQMLLDVICYEMQVQRLSPEMTMLVKEHLETCTQCRTGVGHFEEVLRPHALIKNFG